ncbi:hypothetical protein GCM10020229_70110 [Kitasatospora albolonga]
MGSGVPQRAQKNSPSRTTLSSRQAGQRRKTNAWVKSGGWVIPARSRAAVRGGQAEPAGQVDDVGEGLGELGGGAGGEPGVEVGRGAYRCSFGGRVEEAEQLGRADVGEGVGGHPRRSGARAVRRPSGVV